MAESGADPNVEDVLSSVRRLVSNEIPRNSRPTPPNGPGALVLEDSQRIEAKSAKTRSAKSLEDRIAELEAAVNARSDDWEPDGSEDQNQHRPDRIVYTRPPTQEESDEVRRSTLRLSQIELIETVSEEEQAEDVTASMPRFRHETDDDLDAVSAPMAENVPIEPRQKAEVRAFSNPDDELERIEARINAGGEAAAETQVEAAPEVASKEVKPEPKSEDFSEPSVGRQDEPESPALDKEVEEVDNEFEDALNRAVSNSLQPPTADGRQNDEAELDPLILASRVEQTADEDALSIVLPISEDEETGSVATETASDALSANEQSPPEQRTEVANTVGDRDEPDAGSEAEQEMQTQIATAPDSSSLPDADASEDEDLERAVAIEAIGQAVGEHFDEDALQPVVAQLIRKELQGELGERITRNVRKLVRREIKRALLASELD